MKQLLILLFLFSSSILSFAQVHVRGYYRKNGTYVQPHERTRPNHTITDNYSYPGNFNPNIGRITGDATTTSGATISTSSGYNISTYSSTTSTTPSSAKVDYTDVPSVNSVTTNTLSSQLYAFTEPNAALKKEPSYMSISSYAIPSGAVVKVSNYNENYYLAEVGGYSGYLCICHVKKIFTRP